MLLSIGILIGLLLGLTGAGGSIFAVPLLVMLAGLPMSEAVGISLGAVMTSTLYGSLARGRKGQILWLPGLLLAASGAITAPLGKYLGNQLPDMALTISFSLLAAVIAVRMWWTATHQPKQAQVVRAGVGDKTTAPGLRCALSSTGQFELKTRCVSGLLLGGAIVGLLSGLFGVGGGFMIVPLLMALSAVSINQAVNTSLLIITLISGSGFFSHLAMSTPAPWIHLLWVSVGGILGMVLGQLFSARLAGARLQQFFAIAMLVVALVFGCSKLV